MRPTALATTVDHCAPERAPSANVTFAGATGGEATDRARLAGRCESTPIVVIHHREPRLPTRTSGTTSIAPAGESAENENEPNATGPVPGRCTSLRTTAWSTTDRHQACASAKRPAPLARSSRAGPSRPVPRRGAPTTKPAWGH